MYLDQIENEAMRKAVIKVKSRNSYKLHYLPSSFTGQHHPKDEHGIDGLNKHIEKVCWFLDNVVQEFEYTQEFKDILLTAAYFHDLGKLEEVDVSLEVEYGKGEPKFSTKVSKPIEAGGDNHPFTSAKIAEEYLQREGVPKETIEYIKRLILTHMSHYLKGTPRPESELEKMFALADFTVSRDDFAIIKQEGQKKKWFH